MIELRNVQVPAVEKAMKYFETPKKEAKPVLIVAPTAFGKSIVISKVAHDTPGKVIVIQPSKELLQQNYAKLIALGGEAKIYSASLDSKEIGDITYATIGSIVKIGHKFKELGFTKIIIDEADRYPVENSGMLRRFVTATKIVHVLGFTATAFKLQTYSGMNDFDRCSKLMMLTKRIGKGNFFKEIIHVCQVNEMIEGKWWSPIVYDLKAFDEKALKFNTTGAEFTDVSLKLVYQEQNIREKILEAIEQNPDRKSILVAVPSVQDAIELAEIIPNSVAVYGDMPKEERKRAVEGFKDLSIRVAINVNVLTVGFDHPLLDMLIAGRPTASLSWWYQFLGRGTRIDPLKENVLLVDLVGNTRRFGKIEKLFYQLEGTEWKLYGEGDKLLTGIRIDEIGQHTMYSESIKNNPFVITFGKHIGKEAKDIPKEYRNMLLEAGDFRPHEQTLKQELMRLQALGI